MKKIAVSFCLLLLVGVGMYVFAVNKLTVFTIQPIGAIPDGASILMWKKNDEPFFNSPDAMCLKIQKSVSLLCRGMMLSRYVDKDNIIYRIKYRESFYLKSTDGRKYDR